MDWKAISLAAECAVIALAGIVEGKGPSEQVVRGGSFELDLNADKALELFTPEGERAWVKGWNPQAMYPAQGSVRFQTNTVFRVDEGSERSLWTILQADLRARVAEYVYFVEGERVSRVRVEIQPLGVERCRVRVQYVHTAISEKGLEFVAGVTEDAFAQKMRDWQSKAGATIR